VSADSGSQPILNSFKTVTKQKRWVDTLHDPVLTALVEQGKSDYFIADAMGFSHFAIQNHRQKLGLEPTRKPITGIYETPRSMESKPSPLAVAAHWLASRLVEKPGGYFLDGTPVSLNQLMKETNRLLAKNGLPQRLENPLWGV